MPNHGHPRTMALRVREWVLLTAGAVLLGVEIGLRVAHREPSGMMVAAAMTCWGLTAAFKAKDQS